MKKLLYHSQLITPVMGIKWPCIFRKVCFDILKSIGFGDLIRLFSSLRQSDSVYLTWFVWHLLRRLFKVQAVKRWSVKTCYGFGPISSSISTGFQSKSTSLKAGIHMWVQAVQYNLFSSGVFLPYFTMLILSVSLLELGSKSTSFSLGFCVCRPKQYDTICWELTFISGLCAFF